MGTVLIKAFPVSSHYNATFRIASVLKNQFGHRIIYLGHDSFGESVRANGFEYLTVHAFVRIPHSAFNDVIPQPQVPAPKKRRPFRLSSLKQVFVNRKSIIYKQKSKLQSEPAFKKLMDELTPDLVIVDTFYDFEIPMFFKNNIPVVIYQTKFSTNKEKNVPPLTAAYVPSSALISTIITELYWARYFISILSKKFRDYIFYSGRGPLATFHIVLDTFQYPRKLLYTKRTFNPGFVFTWEFLLSPLELDFKRQLAPFQVVLSPAPGVDRSDVDFDYSFLEFNKHLSETQKKVIYCSLGSISDIHSKNCMRFYKRIIRAIENRDDLLLILSVGFTHDPSQFKTSSKNIFVFQKVPQLEVLKTADLMVTHGGMQSITECILSNTPMIVYPLNNSWDQNGNSARVLYHNVGLRGHLNSDSQHTIAEKIDKVLNSPYIKTNVSALGDKMRNSRHFDEGIGFLNSLITKSRPTIPSLND